MSEPQHGIAVIEILVRHGLISHTLWNIYRERRMRGHMSCGRQVPHGIVLFGIHYLPVFVVLLLCHKTQSVAFCGIYGGSTFYGFTFSVETVGLTLRKQFLYLEFAIDKCSSRLEILVHSTTTDSWLSNSKRDSSLNVFMCGYKVVVVNVLSALVGR